MTILIVDQNLINQVLQHFTQMEAKIMAAIDDLNNAVETLSTDVTACIADLKANTASAVTAAEAALNTQTETAVSNVNALDAQVKAADPGPQA